MRRRKAGIRESAPMSSISNHGSGVPPHFPEKIKR
jgi:hypothetical protein